MCVASPHLKRAFPVLSGQICIQNKSAGIKRGGTLTARLTVWYHSVPWWCACVGSIFAALMLVVLQRMRFYFKKNIWIPNLSFPLRLFYRAHTLVNNPRIKAVPAEDTVCNLSVLSSFTLKSYLLEYFTALPTEESNLLENSLLPEETNPLRFCFIRGKSLSGDHLRTVW